MIRRLRYARADHCTLNENKRHVFANQYALAHYASNTVFSFIPKNGCTTLRYSLAIANGAITGADDFNWIHLNNHTFKADLRALSTARYTFVILRCPYARLASAFLDKIVAGESDAKSFLGLAGKGVSLDTLTFREFVTLLSKPGLVSGNIHWRMQSDFLLYENYDSWFRLEAFSEALAEITARTGMVIHDSRPLAGHDLGRYAATSKECFADTPIAEIVAMRGDNRSPAHAALYDAKLIERVKTLYRRDIDLYWRHFGPEGLLFA